ncbi:probably inactive leucine-rich repeat receptor-like protein kinase At5g48380 [Miscanthus floridulus]|uniref:probably inactive leucine-rich repeat receptor-like protein kinase At5g48380 n=1 Tax=Miscanthus floridulus TaxID=154761 RepID=UPI0034577E5B
MSRMADNTKFVLWLLLLSGSSSCFGSDLDVQCLKTIQQSVIDPNGILKYWIFDNSTNGFICRFTGVECWHPDENRVLGLRLSNWGLQGQFPKGLQNCSRMDILDLSSNNFSGQIPSDIARQLPFLTTLDLSYNSFSGEIPLAVSNMSYLNTLNLQRNRLSGEIPWEFSFLNRLSKFNVADNHLSGPIPFPLTKFPAWSFAGNQGLCGEPLSTKCDARSRRNNDESSIGAAAGFVVGFVVAFYFPRLFVVCQRLHPYVVRI